MSTDTVDFAALSPRQAAIAQGSNRYHTGIPCPAGHMSDRLVKGSRCVACKHAANHRLRRGRRGSRYRNRDE